MRSRCEKKFQKVRETFSNIYMYIYHASSIFVGHQSWQANSDDCRHVEKVGRFYDAKVFLKDGSALQKLGLDGSC